MSTEAEAQPITPDTVVVDPNVPIQWNLTDATIADLRERAEQLPSVWEEGGYAAVKSHLSAVRECRYGLEHYRKKLKAGILEYAGRVDSEAARIKDQLLEIESELLAERDAYDKKKAEEKAAKEAERRRLDDELRAKVQAITDTLVECVGGSPDEIAAVIENLRALEIDESYGVYQTKAEATRTQTMERLVVMQAAAEAEIRQREQAAEAERQRLQAEADRREQEEAELARQRAEIEALRAEQAAEIEAQRKAQEAEAAKVREAQAAEQRRLDAEAAERRRQQEAEAAAERAKQEAERRKLDAERAELEAQRAADDAKRRATEEAEAAKAAAAERERRAEEVRRANQELIDGARGTLEAFLVEAFDLDPNTGPVQRLVDAIVAGDVPHVRFDPLNVDGDL
jgi:hypothetical protein